MKMELRIAHLEQRIKRWDRILSNIQSSRKHYLRKRMAGNSKRERAYQKALGQVERLEALLKGAGVSQEPRLAYGRLKLFICTKAQARKLRKIADEDGRKKA